MGLLKKITKSVSKVGKAVNKAAISATNVVVKTAQGDVSGAVKEGGKLYGSAMRLGPTNPYGVFESKKVNQALNNQVVRKLTFDSSREFSNTQKGFRDLSRSGQADKTFYQGVSSLGVKGAVGAFAVSKAALTKANYLTTQAVVTGVKNKDASAIASAFGADEVAAFLPGAKAPRGPASVGDSYSDSASYSSGSTQIAYLGVILVAGYFIFKK